MNIVTIIGDVHGKLPEYQEIISKPRNKNTICVGDFGFKKEWDWHMKNVDPSHHKIVMGNHDYTAYANEKPSLGDFGMYNGIFTVRGAFSIDKVHRTEGISWFADEELSYSQGLECFDLYKKERPNIVISHDAPHYIRQVLFGITDKSNTSNLLQAMFDEYQPKLWLFGHHHKERDANIFGTRFICLEELQTRTIDLDNI